MLIAEIRRKLLDLEDIAESADDPIGQVRAVLSSCKEDLLTADVFGAIKYLPRTPYLLAVLRAVADRNSEAKWFREHVSKSPEFAERCDFAFWPTYRTPPGIPGQITEPDVELSAPDTLIFVEAKLFSGFGVLQIERQLLIGLEQAKGREFFLILVTAGIRPPRLRLKDKRLPVDQYVREVANSETVPKQYRRVLYENADRVLWVSWPTIFSSLEQAHRKLYADSGVADDQVRCAEDMLADLRTLLEMRQLQPFAGIGARAKRVTTTRPIFFPADTIVHHTFGGILPATLPGLLTVARLPHPTFAKRNSGERGGAVCDIRPVVAQRVPQPLPAQWLATRQAQSAAQGVAEVVKQYRPQHLAGHFAAFSNQISSGFGGRTVCASNLIRSVVEQYEPQALHRSVFSHGASAAAVRSHRAPHLQEIVSGTNFPPGPFRLLRKGKHNER